MKKGKKGCLISDVIFVCIFGCILSVIVARAAWYFGEVQLKSDNALTTENLVRVVSIRLEAYKEEHGTYPPQQDMKSLLETLGIRKSDFRKTFFFDLYSAEYHAPAEDSNDPEDRLITMHVKWHLFEGYDHLLFLRREGTVGTEYLKDTR